MTDRQKDGLTISGEVSRPVTFRLEMDIDETITTVFAL